MRARQFIRPKKTQLDEIKMSPSSLKNFVDTHPIANEITAGFELELCFKGISPGESEGMEDQRVERWSLREIQDILVEYIDRNDSRWDNLLNDYYDAHDERVRAELESRQVQEEIEERAKEFAEESLSREEIQTQAKELAASSEGGSQLDPSDFLDQAEKDLIEKTFPNFLDQAEEEILDKIRENYDYDFDEWLYYEFNYLSDITSALDLYVDFDNGERTPFDVYDMQEAGRKLTQLTGIKVRVSDDYHGVSRGDQIIIEPDTSIDPSRQNHGAAEIISPPLPLKQTIELYKKTVEWALDPQIGGYANSSTGFHFNISSPDLTKFNYLKMALLLGDNYVLESFQRQYNSYCRSALSAVFNTFFQEIPANLDPKNLDKFAAWDESDIKKVNRVEKILEALRSRTFDTAKLFVERGVQVFRPSDSTWSTEKYLSLHWKGEYLEVRSIGGERMLENVDQTLTSINRIVRVWASAVDPNLDQEEYLKKFYAMTQKAVEKITAPSARSNLGKILAQYITGNRDNASLIPAIRDELERMREKRKKNAAVNPTSRLPQTSPQMNLELRECKPGK